jgi:hypothetical protein
MKNNPVVSNVRNNRKHISMQYGNDLKKLVNHYQRMEQNVDCKFRLGRMLRKAG